MMTSSKNTVYPNAVPSSSFNNNKMPSPTPVKKAKRSKRKAAAMTSKDEAPMFLRKAFHIINNSDPQIAAWSDDGLSFYVKDPDRFATEVIPKCFKHNHFSSFVRQLNFYGFRKLRDDHIELENVDEQRAKWCHFRHPKFQRGRQDLLKEISKNTHKEVAEKTELDALRAEVKDLKAVIKNMKKDFGILASLVGDLSKQVRNNNNNDVDASQPPLKKQRISAPAVPTTPPTSNKSVALPPPMSKQEAFGGERTQSGLSTVSFTSEDEEFLNSLFSEDGLNAESFGDLPDPVMSA